MKTLLYPLFCAIFLLSAIPGQAQGPPEPKVLGSLTYGGDKIDIAEDVIELHDSSLVVVGRTKSSTGDVGSNQGIHDMWVVCLGASNNIRWERTYGGSNDDLAYSVVQTYDSNLVVAGFTKSSDGDVSSQKGERDMWLVKIDYQTGDIIWEQTYGGSNRDWAYTVIECQDSTLIVAGDTESSDGDVVGNHSTMTGDIWVLNVSQADGSLIWQKCYGGSNYEYCYDITQLQDGNLAFSGQTNSTNGDITALEHNGQEDIWVAKIAKNDGAIQWQNCYGGSDNDKGKAITQLGNGNILVAADIESNDKDASANMGQSDMFLMELSNSTGGMLQSQVLGGSDFDYASGLVQLSDGTIGLVGQTYSSDYNINRKLGGGDLWLAKVSSKNLSMMWGKTIGGSDLDKGQALAERADGTIAIAGQSFSSDYDISQQQGDGDFWLVIAENTEVPNLISGKVFFDQLGNGIYDDTADYGTRNYIVKLEPYGYYTNTDADGDYSFYVQQGDFTVSLVVDSVKGYPIVPADNQQQVSFSTNDTSTDASNFSMAGGNTLLQVDATLGGLRRCRHIWDRSYITYRNLGNMAAKDAYILVETDDKVFYFASSSHPYEVVEDGLYKFELGDVDPYEEYTITLATNIYCDASIGTSGCMTATIYPRNNIYIYADTAGWDRSSVEVTGECVHDSAVVFSIKNTGDPGEGDMAAPTDYRVYVDNVLTDSGQVQLAGGASHTLSFIPCGHAIRVETDQRPGHPGHSRPRETVEGCGASCGDPVVGTVNDAPKDDQVADTDMDCGIVRLPWDPNDKAVAPAGITQDNYIGSDKELALEYKIRFQNTGNDTAYFIYILDTLSENLDMSSVVMKGASHDYTFEMYGTNILKWTFNDIMLPDSNVNEPESHGFVKFEVKPKDSIQQGDVIENFADIYFEYNEPVRTNTVKSTFGDAPAQPSPLTAQSLTMPQGPTICEGETAELIGAGGYDQLWEGHSTILQSADGQAVVKPATTTTYYMLGADFTGWTLKDSVTVKVKPAPDFTLSSSSDTVGLGGNSVQLSASGAESYQWSEEGLSGATPSISPTANTTYTVTGTDANGCEDTASITIVVTEPTGMEEAENIQLTLYPNPTDGKLYIESEEAMDKVEIYSQTTLVKAIAPLEGKELDLSGLPAGVYFIRLYIGESVVVRKVSIIR